MAAVHRRGLACDGRGTRPDHRLHCSAADPGAEVARVGLRDRPVRVRTRPDTVAGASNCPANVVNTAAIEDCVADMVTSAAVRAFQHPARRDLVPSCSHRACAADAAVASDNLELPCHPAVAAAVAAVVDPGDHRKEDDSGTQLSNDPAAAAAAIDYRGLDYYYYYLIDSVLAAVAADLELGSDYWRGAAASVNFADQLPAT